jgi:hypothetical protein
MAHYLIVLRKPLFIGLLVYIWRLWVVRFSDIDTFIGLRLYKYSSSCAAIAANV